MKAKIISVLAAAAMLASATPAFAATISNPLFSNGQTSIDATGGATVSGTYTLTVGPGEVVEYVRTQSGDVTMPPADTSVGGTLGYQEQVYYNLPFSQKVSPNTGTYTPTMQSAGIWGGGRSINGGDAVNSALTNLGTVRVVAAGGSTGGSTTDSTSFQAQLDALMASLTKLTAAVAAITAGNTGSTGAHCPVPLYTGMNASTVQGWLLNNGYASGFNAAGVYAPTGYWGSISAGAYAQASAACAK